MFLRCVALFKHEREKEDTEGRGREGEGEGEAPIKDYSPRRRPQRHSKRSTVERNQDALKFYFLAGLCIVLFVLSKMYIVLHHYTSSFYSQRVEHSGGHSIEKSPPGGGVKRW